ncbi:hypothetical protein LTR84_000927 [Exophiala bonariae]|uniref:Amino acid permease/ SLC12A domain-containing protein n=1 Tax=Exophiala bonariae TaxID=1690606 RepID=A0AAV9NRY9_9EURO|nr:hypothetical protein LTR84_000927 [Exophiala bonariae]
MAADGNSAEKLPHEAANSPSSSSMNIDVEDATSRPAKLRRDLQGRHMQMIAIGGSIGAGFFVGSGRSLAVGGPASLLLGFAITGVMVLCMIMALGELSVMYPENGAFYAYVVRFLDPGWGSTIGWMFEFVLGIIKLIAVAGFIIFGIVANTGGVPTDQRGYLGFKYWSGDDGNRAFRNGFPGFCSVFVVSAFAFGGTELVGLAAAEAVDPQKSIPKATKQVLWRIAGVYILGSLILGIVVPNSAPELLGAYGANTKASPFVLAFQIAGVKSMPSVFNAIIAVSTLSVANSCTYGSTRTLQALAQRDMAPKFIAYVDNKGRPLVAVAIQLLFGLLAFIAFSAQAGTVFTWLFSISGLGLLFLWASICLSHIRFRQAWKAAGRSIQELPFKSPLGIYGSYFALFLILFVLVLTLYVAIKPPGAPPSAMYFFQNWLSGPLALTAFAIRKLWARDWTLGVKVDEIDLDAGRREDSFTSPRVHEEEKRQSFAQRVIHAVF